MDIVPLHAQIAHLPLALSLLMPFVALGVLLAWRREHLPRAAWLIVVALQAVLFVTAMAAERTGHQEEKRIEQLVAEHAVGVHEDAGETFAWVSGVVLLITLTVPAMGNAGAAQALAAVSVGAMLVVLVLGYRTGIAGGRLIYQHGAASAYVTSDPAARQQEPQAP
ncbi:MAG TPA: hypothetical protein VEC57_17605 [Candidatus Limnocylindrales bacterium]|nr:hypothetical protein [Candidatus Limnocylindrales bacterium]